MERLKVLTKFNLSEDELEQIVGGVDMATADYSCGIICAECIGCSGSCIGCEQDCTACTKCVSCESDCTLCTSDAAVIIPK